MVNVFKQNEELATAAGGIPPEMLEAFKAFMASQGSPATPAKAPAPAGGESWGQADSAHQKPEDVISFGEDSTDFGKY